MSSVNDGSLQENYFIYNYYQQLYGNLVDMKTQVDARYEHIVQSIATGPDVSAHIKKLADNDQARLNLYGGLLDFIIEALKNGQQQRCNLGSPDSATLKLLSFSSNDTQGSSLGTLIQKGFDQPALSIDTNEPCSCFNVKCAKCIQDEQVRATEAGACADNQSAELTVVDPPSSEGPQSMLDLRLSLLMKDVPAAWDNLAPSPQPSYPSSLSSLNLRGPGNGFRHQVLHLPPKVQRSALDVHFHWAGSFACCSADKPKSSGLFFQSNKTMNWVKVSEGRFLRMCCSYRGIEVFTVSGVEGDNWVKKFDMKTTTPLQTGSLGYFQVSGGKVLSDISMSYGGRLAVCDYGAKRVTIHEPSGNLFCELKKEKFEGCWPFNLCWFNEEEEKLLVKVYGREDDIFRIYCFLIPSGDWLWTSEKFTGLWSGFPIYSREDQIYCVAGGRPIYFIRVLSGESGETIQETHCEVEGEPVRVMDVGGQLTVICYKRTK